MAPNNTRGRVLWQQCGEDETCRIRGQKTGAPRLIPDVEDSVNSGRSHSSCPGTTSEEAEREKTQMRSLQGPAKQRFLGTQGWLGLGWIGLGVAGVRAGGKESSDICSALSSCAASKKISPGEYLCPLTSMKLTG